MKRLLCLTLVCLTLYGRCQVMCFGDTYTLVAGNPLGLSQVTYSLNPGATQNLNGVFVVSPTVTTSFSLYTSGYNSNLQYTTTLSTPVVTVFAKPQVNPMLFHPTCTNSLGGFDLQLTFQPVSPIPGYTISWLGLPNNILSPQQTTASGVFGGSYSATITAAGGCSAQTHFTVNPAPAPAVFTFYPSGDTLKLTCTNPSLAVAGSEAGFSYIWNSLSTGPIASTTLVLESQHAGSWSVTGTTPEGICSATHTFFVLLDQQSPVTSISPSVQTISCIQSGLMTVTLQATPAANLVQTVNDPLGGVYSSAAGTTIYKPGSVGVFTHCAVNSENGCKTCKQFTVNSNEGFPTFNLVSPDNFTLGCGSKSVATIQIMNASATGTDQVPNAGPVSFTVMPPGSSGVPGGTLSSVSTYTMNQPGTYTVVVQDLNNACRTRLPVTILQNNAGPPLTAIVPIQVLDCTYTTTVLKAASTNTNVDFNWSFPGIPGNLASNSVEVHVDLNAPSKTVINDYTLTITDQSSLCKSFSVVTMFQNVFPPKTGFALSAPSITCKQPFVVMTNSSTTGIPAGVYPSPQPVSGWLWTGPTPQQPLQVSTTYVGGVSGTYTLVGKDLNNGCTSVATMSVGDFRLFPILNMPDKPGPSMLECGGNFTTLSPIITTNSSALLYTWTAPPTATIGNQHTATLTTNEIGVYTITVTDSRNDCTASTTMNVVSGTITADFDIDKPQGTAPHLVNFYNNSSYTRAKNVGNEGIVSVWSFGNGQISGKMATGSQGGVGIVQGIPVTEKPAILYSAAGDYTVTLFVAKGNCLDSSRRVIRVELPSALDVPNVFTPNGDGINDEFFLKADRIGEITMYVYDRWGQLVYKVSSAAGNISWNGTDFKGNEVSEGVFYYTISALGKDGNRIDEKGTITLLR